MRFGRERDVEGAVPYRMRRHFALRTVGWRCLESPSGFVIFCLPLEGKVARNATDEVERDESN